MKNSFPILSKKHWIVYASYGILILIGLLCIFTNKIFSSEVFGRPIGLILVVYNVFKMLSVSKVKWELTSKELIISGGLMPWSKTEFQVPIYTVFESFYSRSILGHFLNYGTITIRRTEGSTSHIVETRLANVRHLSAIINSLVDENKKKETAVIKPSPKSQTATSIAEELAKLSELKTQGHLTPEEFDQMKKKLLS